MEVRDQLFCPGLRLRISANGHRAFVLVTRYPGSAHPTRRTLGRYPILTLKAAREKALAWLRQVADGEYPGETIREARRQAALAKVRATTGLFGQLVEDFIVRPDFDKQSRPVQVAKLLRNEFASRWGDWQTEAITRADCKAALLDIKARAPTNASAHVAFAFLHVLLNYAVDDDRLKVNPLAGAKPSKWLGDRIVRDRVLTDDEVRAIWQAAGQIGYPYGFSVRMLFHTCSRLEETNDLRWSEVNTSDRLLTIPKDRMKSGRTFEVPYNDGVAALLDSLPRFTAGDAVFSVDGRNPIRGYARYKRRIDELSGVTGWRHHDIRRTVRTRWSALASVPDMIKELAMDHTVGGLHKTYDLHSYRTEKRQLLKLWEAQLANIIDPPPANVVQLHAVA